MSQKFQRLGSDSIQVEKLRKRDSLGWARHWPISREIVEVLERLKNCELTAIASPSQNGRRFYGCAVAVSAELGLIVRRVLFSGRGPHLPLNPDLIGSSLEPIYEERVGAEDMVQYWVDYELGGDRFWIRGTAASLAARLVGIKVGVVSHSNDPRVISKAINKVILENISEYLLHELSDWEVKPSHDDSRRIVCKVEQQGLFDLFQFAVPRLNLRTDDLHQVELFKVAESENSSVFETCLAGEPAAIELLFSLIRQEI